MLYFNFAKMTDLWADRCTCNLVYFWAKFVTFLCEPIFCCHVMLTCHAQKPCLVLLLPVKDMKSAFRNPKTMKKSIKFLQNFTFLFLLINLPHKISALSITVNDVECVYEYIPFDGDTVVGNFVAVDHDIFWASDHPGIDLVVSSPGGNTVRTVKGTSGDKFEFKAPRAGIYKFCFHNPQKTPETVSFYIHSGHIPSEHNLAKDEHLDPVNVKIAELREALESVTAEQKYLKAREARHRHTNESTRRRLILYTILEYIVLVSASALQVVYIRRLFNKSVAYNRV